MKKNAILCLFVIVFHSLMLTSCTNNVSVSSLPSPTIIKMQPTSGSAATYLRNSLSAMEEEKLEYLINAATLMINNGQEEPARQILASLPQDLPERLENKLHLLLGSLFVQKHQTKNALKSLSHVTSNSLNKEEFIFYNQILARSYMQKSDWLNSAISLISIDKLLDGSSKDYNRQQIFYRLFKVSKSSISTQLLEQSINSSTPWLELVSIYQQNSASPEKIQKLLLIWQQKYKNNDISRLISNNLEIAPAGSSKKIALLLPITGPLNKAGIAIREGFTQAMFKYRGDNSYSIQLYDTHNTKNISALYRQSIEDGASFVIGPLSKEHVAKINKEANKVNTIVLNLVEPQTLSSSYIYQLSLNMAQEAELAALKAFEDGHRTAVVIWPLGEWGQNIRDSFNARWKSFGGEIVDEIKISPENKLDNSIIEMLGLTNSNDRKLNLKPAFSKLTYYPQIRKDIDMIFIASSANDAHQIIPLLKFNYANNIPIYSTSAIYKGHPKVSRDGDLNGVMFCDMPSILKLPLNRQYTEWPDYLNSKERLTNLGFDAFTIMANLSILNNTTLIGMPAKSGYLFINSQNQIERILDWAKFSQGRPRIIKG